MKPDTVAAQGVRLQKVIAQAGVTSRRKAEALIVQGRVIVNGKKITTLGSTVDPTTDSVVVDGKPLRLHAPLRPVQTAADTAISSRTSGCELRRGVTLNERRTPGAPLTTPALRHTPDLSGAR